MTLRNGAVVAEATAALRARGVAAAQLEPGDVGEDGAS